MWTPQSAIRSGRDRSFGIGFSLGEFNGELSVSHGGAIYGFATQLKVLPGSKIGVAISTNLDMANGAVNRIADHALRVLLAQKNGEASPGYQISTAVSEAQAQQLLGDYVNDEATIQVTRRFGDLYVERVRGLSLRLRDIEGQIVIDDIMTFSDDVVFSDDTVAIFGTEYERADAGRPAISNSNWIDLIGEYGFDHNVLCVHFHASKLAKLLHDRIERGREDHDEDRADDHAAEHRDAQETPARRSGPGRHHER